jgi:hypothetical protein
MRAIWLAALGALVLLVALLEEPARAWVWRWRDRRREAQRARLYPGRRSRLDVLRDEFRRLPKR